MKRPLGAVAHLAVFLGYFGLLVSGGILVWAWIRRDSYLGHQAFEAATYQAAVLLGLALLGWIGLGTWFGGSLLGFAHLAAMVYGAYGAFAALDGRPFHYVSRL